MAEQSSWVLLPCCSPPGHPFPIKSLALSTRVIPWTIHFRVLDKSPLLGPGRGPPSCNSRSLDINPNDWNRHVTGKNIQVATTDTIRCSASLLMKETHRTTTPRYHYTPTRTVRVEKTYSTEHWGGWGQVEVYCCSGQGDGMATLQTRPSPSHTRIRSQHAPACMPSTCAPP